MDEYAAAEGILRRGWEIYAKDKQESAGKDHPGRERIVELFGEPHDFEEVVAPFGAAWPGLAAPAGAWPDADRQAAEVLAEMAEDGGWEECRLDGVHRAADLPDLAERRGLMDCWVHDAQELSAVLRSWEERFGTRLVGVGPDRVIVSVAAPARTAAEAQAVAAEHFAFSPDTITQGDDETLAEYAANQVLDAEAWVFWWD